MGRVGKGAKCSVANCSADAVRSISAKRIALPDVDAGRGGRVYLCRVHYKAHKKRTGASRRVERWRWNA